MSSSSSYAKSWKRIQRSPFFRAGLPTVLFVLVSFAGLQKFVEGKQQLEDLSRGKRMLTTREYDLEEDYKKTMKKLNPDYQLKPIDRPD